MFIDAQTGKTFEHETRPGETIPVRAPSGGDTGFPPEWCYWTADGKIKDEPTPVLLNVYLEKPEPTFCKDCGRLVVERNRRPNPGDKPPPTQAQYKPRKRVANGR